MMTLYELQKLAKTSAFYSDRVKYGDTCIKMQFFDVSQPLHEQ